MASYTPFSFAEHMGQPVEYYLGKITRESVNRGALRMKTAAQTNLLAAVPSGRLRNAAKARGLGKQMRVFYRLYGHVNAFAIVATSGPVPIVERGTVAHMLTGKGAKTSGRGAKARRAHLSNARKTGYVTGLGTSPLLVSGSYEPGKLARYARHPGTKGTHPFGRAISATQGEAVQAIVKAIGAGDFV